MDNVEQFIDQLIDEKDLNLEDDVRQELKVDMINRLLDQIDAASINALPEDKAIELADKLDDPDFSDDDLTEFMRNSGVDLEKVALETMVQFRLLYIGGDPEVDMDAMVNADAEPEEGADEEGVYDTEAEVSEEPADEVTEDGAVEA
jgi:hypothetical protein